MSSYPIDKVLGWMFWSSIGIIIEVVILRAMLKREVFQSLFLWISMIRMKGRSVLLTRERGRLRELGIQASALLFAFFALYLHFFPLTVEVFELFWIKEALTWFQFITFLLTFIFITMIPGFFVGFLTGSEKKARNSIGFGTFLATWVNCIYWLFVSILREYRVFVTLALDILLIVLVLLGVTIISFIVSALGTAFGAIGGIIGEHISVGKFFLRKEALAWELEDQLKALKEQLGSGAITKEEYEQKKKKLLKEEN